MGDDDDDDDVAAALGLVIESQGEREREWPAKGSFTLCDDETM